MFGLHKQPSISSAAFVKAKLTVDSGASFHLLLANDGSDLHQGFGVVIGLEEGKAPSQEREQDDADRPNIKGFLESQLGILSSSRGRTYGLIGTFEQDLRSSETSSTSSIGSNRRTAPK
jgi:hypothetical protein